MATVTLEVKGGGRLEQVLLQMAKRLGNGASVRVGFLEDADYNGNAEYVAQIEGALKRLTGADRAAHPDWASRMSSWAAWGATHNPQLKVATVAFWNEFGTRTAPARPFFRNMIKKKSPKWGESLAYVLKASGYDTAKALESMGQGISAQLRQSIQNWPADNAPLTAFIKQFNHGLVNKGTMYRAVNFQVLLGSARP